MFPCGHVAGMKGRPSVSCMLYYSSPKRASEGWREGAFGGAEEHQADEGAGP